MPQSIVLLGPAGVDVSGIQDAVGRGWAVARPQAHAARHTLQFRAEDGVSYIAIQKMDESEESALDYLEWDCIDEQLRTQLDSMWFWLVSFNRFSSARVFLQKFLQNVDMENWWIDNDHGSVIHGPVFLEKLRGQELWDWRNGG